MDLDNIREPDLASIVPDKKSQKEEEYNLNELARNESLKKTFHIWFKYAIRIGFILFSLVVTIRLLHLVLPEDYRWLAPEELQGIDKLMFSGAFGGILAKNLNKLN